MKVVEIKMGGGGTPYKEFFFSEMAKVKVKAKTIHAKLTIFNKSVTYLTTSNSFHHYLVLGPKSQLPKSDHYAIFLAFPDLPILHTTIL